MGALAVRLDPEQLDELAERVASRLTASTPATASPWLTSAEAVEHLRLPSMDALHRLTAAGAVPHSKVGGRCLFNRGELDAWLSDHYAGPPRSVSTAFPRPRNRR